MEEEFYSNIETFSAIAALVGCSATQVGEGFEGLELPEMHTRAELDGFKKDGLEIKKAINAAERLILLLNGISGIHRHMIQLDASLGVEEIRRLRDALLAHGETLLHWQSRESRAGGREPAADIICQAIVKLFMDIGKKISWGHVAGLPDTPFGEAVMIAFEAYGVETGWREHARIWRNRAR